MTINQSMQLAVQHHRSGRFAEAEAICRQVLAQVPDQVDALHLLGVLAGQSGHPDQAIQLIGRAIQIRPGFEAYSNLGVALREKGKLDAAIDAHRTALKLNPNYADAWRNLGVALNAKGLFDEAMAAFARALEIKPDFADVHFNIGVLMLLRGNFRAGWPEYEWRWKLQSQLTSQPVGAGQWDGSQLHGQNILIYAEQGIGDTLQFVRYVPLVVERGGRVSVECQRELVPLLEKRVGIERIIAAGAQRPRFERHCALLSLPLVFSTDLGSLPAQAPYLKADPELVEKWKTKFGPAHGPRVGLTWAGRPTHKNDRCRSIDLAQFAPLWRVKGVEFYSLQKGQSPGQAPPAGTKWFDWTDDLHDFAQTAALVENLDLVVTVDTAVAHLAGAMGKPVWVLLPFVPDWRWLLDREDSPWYPAMRLFRQSAINDWASVIQRVAERLAQRV
jgi:Flp pilus assembly protein TadD